MSVQIHGNVTYALRGGELINICILISPRSSDFHSFTELGDSSFCKNKVSTSRQNNVVLGPTN